MHTPFQTQLRIPAEGRFLPLIQGHVRDVAHVAGLVEQDVLALELAAEEAFVNICQHAYPDGTPGDVLVDVAMFRGELRVSFQDHGLPFDPGLIASRSARSGDEVSGLGFKLIHGAVDEVRWENRGRAGKALWMVKRLPDVHAEDARAIAACVERAAPAQAPEQDYALRPFKPDDALQVARLFWMVYGYSYKNEAFYRPEGLLDLMARGTLFSSVIVTGEGEVVGHAALLRPEAVPMAEMALLVVSPAHRGRGLMRRLQDAMEARAVTLELQGISMNPVTSHPFSQQGIIKFGARPCGLELAACPPRVFKAMPVADVPRQRESYLHCFKYLSVPRPVVVHLPQRHKAMIARVYQQLERPMIEARDEPSQDQGAYTVSFDRGLLKGVVRVNVGQLRQWPEIRRAAMDLQDIAGAEVVHLDLPLAQAATPFLCAQAEASGFFFAGVWPHAAADGDVLRLTRLAGPLDLGLVRLDAGFAQELASYVAVEMLRVEGKELA